MDVEKLSQSNPQVADNPAWETADSLRHDDDWGSPVEATLATLLEYTLAAMREVFSASAASLMLLDSNGELAIRVSSGLPADVVKSAKRKIGEGVSGWVAKNVEPLLLNGPVDDDRFSGVDASIAGALSVPLVVQNRVLGVLNLRTMNSGASFTRRDLEMASLIAMGLATAVESIAVYKEAEEDRKQALMLFELGRSLSRVSTVTGTLDVAATVLRDFMPADFCLVLELCGQEWLPRVLAGSGIDVDLNVPLLAAPGGLLERCRTGQEPFALDAAEIRTEGFRHVAREIKSVLAVPVVSSRVPFGVMIFGCSDAHSYSDNALARAALFAMSVATAWNIASNREYLERQAAAVERHRISQDLHDNLAQELSGLLLAIESSQVAMDRDPQAARAQLARAARTARGCLSDVRQYMTALRADQDESAVFSSSLTRLAEDFSKKSGIPVDLDTVGSERRLASEVQRAFLRVTQEALTNIRKHASANRVRLRFEFGEADGRLLVIDDGAGFASLETAARAPSEGKYGLLGMEERAGSVGGTLNINSAPGEGTQIDLLIPYSCRAHGRPSEDNA